ncbi:MAG: hypothetical protein ACR2P9_07480 [Gammaproteobacteria bacterium]
MKKVLITLLLYCCAAVAEDAPVDEAESETTQQPTTAAGQTEPDLPPEVFNPTEQLSEDKDVSFPVDI